MKKWYLNKILLNTLILMMIVGFAAYMFKQSPPIERIGLVIFLTAGTFIMVRGVVKITIGMHQKKDRKNFPNQKEEPLP